MRELTVAEQAMLKTILAKRHASIPLEAREEQFARRLFDELMVSKKSVVKTLRIVTGEELRKAKLDVPPTRPQTHPDQVTGIESDKPAAEPEAASEKLPDVDNKPKTVKTQEQRLSDILQADVDKPRPAATEPQAKFIAADPVKMGDVVVKNIARQGQVIVKGVVMSLDSQGHALVKWSTGQQTYEWAHTLVKAHPLPGATPGSKPGGKDDGEVPGKEHVQKDGDIVEPPQAEASASESPAIPSHTPFQCLVDTLEAILSVARTVKQYREQTREDEEVAVYYDGMLDDLRGIAENILAALSMELAEAQEQAG